MSKLKCIREQTALAADIEAADALLRVIVAGERPAVTILEAMAAQSRIALAEEATSRLLGGIECGDAAGRAAQAFKSALRRHGSTILVRGGPEALSAATDRLSAIPGREADRQAVLDHM